MDPNGEPTRPMPDEAVRGTLRAAMRKRRRDATVRERLDAAAALASRLLPELAGHEGVVAGYWAVGGELPLHAVQANLPATLRWSLPVLHGDGRLRFREWSAGGALTTNPHGIPEPVEGAQLDATALAVVLVPVVAFDARGHRLGQGGGWYDRSFAFLGMARGAAGSHRHIAPRLIGIAYDWQQVDALEAAPWDVPLDAVATPTAFVRFHDNT